MKKKDMLFERYKILVDARNFHYENFNKWLTYFYVANAAIFVGYLEVITSNNTDLLDFKFPIILFGFIAGLLLYWSSKGYYYWNINFIMLVNHYEKKLLKWKPEERIYSMFANKRVQNNYFNILGGANFSTSKIAILFAFIIVFNWGLLLAWNLIGDCITSNYLKLFFSFLISMATILILSIPIKKDRHNNSRHFLWSNTDPLIDLEINQT
jgi:hypothetical protein